MSATVIAIILGILLLVMCVVVARELVQLRRQTKRNDLILALYKNPRDTYETFFNQMADVLRKLGVPEEYDFELSALMWVLGLSSLKVLGKSTDEYKKAIFGFHSAIRDRCEVDIDTALDREMFYSNVFTGQRAYGFWCLTDIPQNIQHNPICRCCLAFSDVVFVPGCMDAYPPTSLSQDFAAALGGNLSTVASAIEIFFSEFIPATRAYCAAISGDVSERLGGLWTFVK